MAVTPVTPATQPDTTSNGAGGQYAPVKAATLTIATDLVGVVGHGLIAGDSVVFSSIATTTGLTAGVTYFVIASGLTANAFKVSATSGGATVDLATADGTANVQLTGRGYTAPNTHNSQQSASVDDTTKTGTAAYSGQYGVIQAATLTDAGDLVGKTAHGYVAGDTVIFSEIVTTTGLTAGTVYYVRSTGLTANAFTVATTAGGAAVALTTDGTANVQKFIDNIEKVPGPANRSFDSTRGYGDATEANPAYAAPPSNMVVATQPDSTTGGGNTRPDANPAYRAPTRFIAVSNVDTTKTDTGSYSGYQKLAVTFTDTGDLVGLTAHGFLAGDAVNFTTIVGTTGLTSGQRYFVLAPTANSFQVSATPGGAAVALTTNGTGVVQRVSTSTDVAGNADMSQVGAVVDASAPGYGVPAAPTGATVTALANGEVRVAWTAPAQVTGANRIGYYVESSLGMSLYVAGNAVSVDIQAWRIEADNQQAQTFTVRAVNKNGSGPKSTPTAAVDVVNINQGYASKSFPGVDVDPVYNPAGDSVDGTGGTPNAPVIGTTVTGVGQVTANWTQSTLGTPTGYRVNVYNNATGVLVKTQDFGLVSTGVVTAVPVTAAVNVKVLALDEVENSAESAASNVVAVT